MKKGKLEQCPFGRGNHVLDPNQLSGDEKRWIAKAHLIGGIQYKELAERFSLSVCTISRWVQAVRKGCILDRKGGRPKVLDPKYHKALVGLLVDQKLNERLDDWELEVQKAVAATAADAGIAPCYVKPISKRSMGRIKKELNVNAGNCECTTTARALAIEDVRNALSFATMNCCCVPISCAELIINVDATQFTCGDTKGSGCKAAYVGQRPRNLQVMPKTGESGLTNYFIKYYATISAAGGQARPIYIIADHDMVDQEIDVHEVKGIGAGSSPAETAFLVFCKTRVPQLEFYKWYIRIVLVPWVQELREIYDLDPSVPAFFQLDGEAAQIAPFLKDTQIRDLMNEHNILVGKPSGSTTATTQALDAGPLFLTSKGFCAETTDLQFAQHWLIRNGRLRKVWDAHKSSRTKCGISDANRKSGIFGVLRIHQSTQRAFHSKAITDSFKVTGTYPFDLGKIFGNCTGKITPNEQLHFVQILPALCKKFKKQNELFEWDFDKYGVRKGTQERGQHLIPGRRRCVLMSGDNFWQREQAKEQAKVNAVQDKVIEKERKRKVTEDKKATKEAKEAAKRPKTAPVPPPAPVLPPPPPPPPPLPVPTGRRQGVTPARFREG
jgi:transposase